MATDLPRDLDPQDVRSHARGEHFLMILIAPWVLGVLGGLVLSLVFGIGMAIGIGSGLAIALGCNFIWIVVVFAIDDGNVDDRVRGIEAEGDVTPKAR